MLSSILSGASYPFSTSTNISLGTVSNTRHLSFALQVSELNTQLSQGRSHQDSLRAEAAAAAAARDAALERVNALRHEVEQLQFMLDEAHAAKHDWPSSKVCVLVRLNHCAGMLNSSACCSA